MCKPILGYKLNLNCKPVSCFSGLHEDFEQIGTQSIGQNRKQINQLKNKKKEIFKKMFELTF